MIFQRHQLLSIALILYSTSIFAQEIYTVKTVPNPKTINNTYVSDPGSLITEVDKTNINQLIDTIEKQTTAEIAVVVLPSIGDEVPKDFAVDLFKTWGIGKKEKDNGLLLLIVMDQRRWEFETGYGLEGDLPDITLKRIGESQLVPGLKEGQIGKGIYDSINAVAEKLKVSNDATSTEQSGISDNVSNYDRPNIMALSDSQQRKWLYIVSAYSFIVILITLWVIFSKAYSEALAASETSRLTTLKHGLYWLIPAILLLSLIYFPTLNLFTMIYYSIGAIWAGIQRGNSIRKIVAKNDDSYRTYQALRNSNGFGLLTLAVLFPVPVAFIALYFSIKLRRLRSSSRNCPKCSTELTRLDEKADDFFLDKGQVLEEHLGSVDYDVWHCKSCEYVQIFAYDAFFTKYNRCPSCHYKAYRNVASRTIVAPTCSSSGRGERDYECQQCNYTKTESYSIPARDCSSSSSGGSSGGGSFGGGSSGGGGAGGRW